MLLLAITALRFCFRVCRVTLCREPKAYTLNPRRLYAAMAFRGGCAELVQRHLDLRADPDDCDLVAFRCAGEVAHAGMSSAPGRALALLVSTLQQPTLRSIDV